MFRIISIVSIATVATAAVVPTYQYTLDPPANVVTEVQLTCNDVPGTNLTFSHLMADVDSNDDVDVEISCSLNIVDTVDGGIRKVTVSQRGSRAREYLLKSFNVKFDKGEATWRGLDDLRLSKQAQDGSGLRSKTVFDALKGVTDFYSVRTNFMHLTVVENTNNHDFGLYTNFEKINEDWLERRALEGVTDTWLYEVKDWDFSMEGNLLASTDPLYEKTKFEKHLEIEGSKNSTKIVALMNTLNATTDAEFPTVFNHHFDINNVATWVAVNIALTGDPSHDDKNFYLFSNSDSDKWYFVPWDYEKAWMPSREGQTKESLSFAVLSDNYLFRRIMITMAKEFTTKVSEKVSALTAAGGAFNETTLTTMMTSYSSVIDPFFAAGKPDYTELTRTPFADGQQAEIFNATETFPVSFSEQLEAPPGIKRSYKDVELVGTDYLYRFKPSFSTAGDAVQHQFTVYTGYSNDTHIDYQAPETTMWSSEWISVPPSFDWVDYNVTAPAEIINQCKVPDFCRINVVARNSMAKIGPYGSKSGKFNA
eukprot:CFRG4421T1